MDVCNWTPSLATVQKKSSSPRGEFKISPITAGFIGTLLVHGLALQTVVVGSAADKMKPPEMQGSGATTVNAEIRPPEMLILLDLESSSQRAPIRMENLASVGQTTKNRIMTSISADPLPHIDIPDELIGDEQDPVPLAGTSDSANRARLIGIYSGQIHARIERGWRRPRTPVDEAAATSDRDLSDTPFNCQVQIAQDSAGKIREVLLPSCNGSVAWQQSLVVAVQQSSPLPAPPDPSVFSRTIILDFIGYNFAGGEDQDEYETQTKLIASFSAR